MTYPRVLSEDLTLDAALGGMSLARFGDGELRLALGGNCISQRETSPKLVAELKDMLRSPPADCLVCIPNALSDTPKAENWARYREPKYTALYGQKTYGSSFITRPDSAPWIDRPDYWDKVEQLWRDRDITLVVGDEKSLTPERCASARSIRIVPAPRVNAYAEIDRIETEILGRRPERRILMCLGVTATVLAVRLAAKGRHALDLGHIGMFRRHAGAYRFRASDLVTDGYLATLRRMHARQRWGADGHKHADAVRALIAQLQPATLLDYGCGREELAKALSPLPIRVYGYDPGRPEKAAMPKPADLVVCTDVLEHIEPDRLDNVLAHLSVLSACALYLVIATRPANAMLPDGRNAHLIVRDAGFWIQKLKALGFDDMVVQGEGARELRVAVYRKAPAARREEAAAVA